jgi:hypothetical protein
MRATIAPWAPKNQSKIEAAAKARIEGNSGEAGILPTPASPKLKGKRSNNNVNLDIKVTKNISQHFAFCNMCAPSLFVPVAVVYDYNSAETLITLIRQVHTQHGVGCPVNICRFNEEWLNNIMDAFPRYEFTRYHPTFYAMRKKCDHDAKYYGSPTETDSRGVEMEWIGML